MITVLPPESSVTKAIFHPPWPQKRHAGEGVPGCEKSRFAYFGWSAGAAGAGAGAAGAGAGAAAGSAAGAGAGVGVAAGVAAGAGVAAAGAAAGAGAGVVAGAAAGAASFAGSAAGLVVAAGVGAGAGVAAGAGVVVAAAGAAAGMAAAAGAGVAGASAAGLASPKIFTGLPPDCWRLTSTASSRVRPKRMMASQTVNFCSTLVVCAPQTWLAAASPKEAPRPSCRGRCMSTTRMSRRQTMTSTAVRMPMKICIKGARIWGYFPAWQGGSLGHSWPLRRFSGRT